MLVTNVHSWAAAFKNLFFTTQKYAQLKTTEVEKKERKKKSGQNFLHMFVKLKEYKGMGVTQIF